MKEFTKSLSGLVVCPALLGLRQSYMGGRRRTIITIESHRLMVVHSRSQFEMWCKKCGKELPLLTPEAAAALAGVSPRAIYRRVESGELHFVETGEGALFICAGSL